MNYFVNLSHFYLISVPPTLALQASHSNQFTNCLHFSTTFFEHFFTQCDFACTKCQKITRSEAHPKSIQALSYYAHLVRSRHEYLPCKTALRPSSTTPFAPLLQPMRNSPLSGDAFVSHAPGSRVLYGFSQFHDTPHRNTLDSFARTRVCARTGISRASILIMYISDAHASILCLYFYLLLTIKDTQ